MIGLIKKDLLLIRKDVWIYIIALGIATFALGMRAEGRAILVSFYTLTIFYATFVRDEKDNFYGYATSLPLGRGKVAMGKYLSYFILMGFALIVQLLIGIIGTFIGVDESLIQVVKEIPYSFLSGAFLLSFILPLLFQFGLEKGKIIFFIVMFGGAYALHGIYQNMNVFINTSIFSSYLSLMCAGLLFLGISFKITEGILKRKDF